MSGEDDLTAQDIYDDLAGIAEVAKGLGVSVFRVRRWIERRETTGCPRPVRPLKQGNVYSMADWRGWFALWKITRGSETWHRSGKDNASG